MKTTVLYAALLSAMTLNAQASPQAEAERVMRSVSIAELAAPHVAPRPPLLGSFARGEDDFGRSLLTTWEETRRLWSSSTIEAVVLNDQFPSAHEDGRLTAESTDALLFLRGEADLVRRAEQTLAHLGSVVLRPIDITARLVRLDRSDLPVVAGSGRVVDLLASGEAIWEGRATTVSGVPVGLGLERYVPFLFGNSIEVAQDARIADPRMRSCFDGIRLVVEPHALAGSDDIVVMFESSFGRLRGLTTRATGAKEHPTHDVPEIETNNASVSGRVASGGALLLTVGGDAEHGSQLVLAVEAKQRGDRPSARFERVGYYPISALTTTAMTGRSRPTHGWSPSHRHSGFAHSVFPIRHGRGGEPSVLGASAGRLKSLVDDLLADKVDAGAANVERNSGFLVIAGDDDVHRRVAAMLTSLQQQWIRTVGVAARTRDRAGANVHHVAFPALLGRHHFVMRGVESTALSDYDVEIAQESELSDPVVDETFSGVFVSLQGMPGAAGGVAAEVDVDVSSTSALRRRSTDLPTREVLHLADVARSSMSHRGAVAADGRIDLGEATDGLRQDVRLTLQQ